MKKDKQLIDKMLLAYRNLINNPKESVTKWEKYVEMDDCLF